MHHHRWFRRNQSDPPASKQAHHEQERISFVYGPLFSSLGQVHDTATPEDTGSSKYG
ncbi:hypothetical protein AND_005565 [Anopheles darlingi]|uniref:Uncharacterized protein n=1 Tax=Anopheles darlingi TaxID=43151 RepID=W5JJ16_ANODA|nr:hypothetical protein AND_005565 [Anopheles darlingi]